MFYNLIWYLFQYQQNGNHNECDLMEECVYPEIDLTENNKNLLQASYNNRN